MDYVELFPGGTHYYLAEQLCQNMTKYAKYSRCNI